MTDESTYTLTLRLPGNVAEAVRDAASCDRRSINSEIVHLLAKALKVPKS